jgi:hypothetical protein
MLCFSLLKRRKRLTGSYTGWLRSRSIDAYYPRLVAAIARLPRLADDDWHSRGEEFIESRRGAGWWRVRNGSALRLVVIYITTLVRWRSGQSFIQQDSAIAIGYSDPTHCRKTRGEAVIVRRGVNDGGTGDGPNIGDAGSLIRGYSGAEQVGYSDCGDDQYDGHHDQKLNKGKAAPSIPYSIRVVTLEHFSSRCHLLKKEGRKPMTSSLPISAQSITAKEETSRSSMGLVSLHPPLLPNQLE